MRLYNGNIKKADQSSQTLPCNIKLVDHPILAKRFLDALNILPLFSKQALAICVDLSLAWPFQSGFASIGCQKTYLKITQFEVNQPGQPGSPDASQRLDVVHVE
ncbi:hypothetical protein DSO57_1008779 [Entomophthora muscae]|uniref:Uncharacterized protein n=1 Tax=Entomophthora muscae TaxID=34485 RepID=A0ACC2UHM8_9FUNG|nr:hypothetical protein DSO57_1008779 [Entomophthora muscae]